MNKLDESNIITSFNFARSSSIVFNELVTKQQFEKLDLNNLDYELLKYSGSLDIVSYRMKTFSLSSGDIIFTNSASIRLLFYYLNKINIVSDLILITSQSDIAITKELFMKKPKVIKKWFAVNVDFDHEDLIPIPLGLANNYSPKNLRLEDFLNSSVENKKIDKLYINLETSTNQDERNNIYQNFENFDWVVAKKPNLTFQNYLDDLKNYKFVLCPWGNGYDTHRVWETLYAGSIPVVKKHQTYNYLKDLPVIFVNEYEDINLQYLLSEEKKLQQLNPDKLYMSYWIDLIKSESKNNLELTEEVKFSSLVNTFFTFSRKIKGRINSKMKIVNYYLRKLSEKLKS